MTRRKNKEDLQEKKRKQLIERSMQILTLDRATIIDILSTELHHCVRINPLAGDSEQTLEVMKQLGWQGSTTTWCEHGYTIDEGYEALRDSKLISEGKIYIQNEASWLPVIALAPRPGDSVLDMCAAPGGKAGHIGAVMNNQGLLLANDNSRPRFIKLKHNLKRLHVDATYAFYNGTRMSKAIEGQQFDKILLDAPCSGEGLIDLRSPKTLASWSVAHIRRLSTLQKQLIKEAWSLLAPGGTLVYSTCTMAPEENEVIINYLLKHNENARILPIAIPIQETRKGMTAWGGRQFDPAIHNALRLLPGDGREAFFVCKIEKIEDVLS